MRITFVLPAPVRVPMGGALVVYRHAEGLAARGHEVRVVAPRRAERGGLALARGLAVRVRDAVQRVGAQPYYQAEGVETVEVAGLDGLPPSDAVIATGVQTSSPVTHLGSGLGVRFYFIQGDETFVRPDARDSWRLPLHRITCAGWLKEEVEASGVPVLGVAPNAVAPEDFGLDTPVEGRGPRLVALYHRHPVKGPDVLVEALRRIREARPDCEADVFCARPPSHRLPRWARVHVRPSRARLRALYNEAAVLLHTSRSEGWPLVPMEAAACGCAVAATSNRGVQEFLEGGVSMRQVPVGDGRALAEASLGLLADPVARYALAHEGRERVARFSWDASTDAFERMLHEGLARGPGR